MVGPPSMVMACSLFCYLFGSYACSRECYPQKGICGIARSVTECQDLYVMLTLPRVRYLISPTGLGVMQRLPHSVAWK